MKIKGTVLFSHLGLWLVLTGLFLPLVWMLATSLKTPEQIFSGSLNPLPSPATLNNYASVMDSLPVLRYTWNTFFIAAMVTAGKLTTSLLAAYGFTQFRFKGREALFYLCLLAVFVPFTVTMMPNYLLLAKLGWLNTYSGAILPHLADGLGIFLMRQSIRSVPASLVEAARLDGIGHGKILLRIILPAVRPSLIALGILFFINSWNEYFWPLLVLNDKSMYTLPVALQAFTNVEGGTDWGVMMAAASLTSLPPLFAYLITQKQVVDTFVQSGIKG
ncbi:MAG: carbohydrate ABC transporter permease [Sporomusaceae bacterium]|nr:carbohydrate ABC transporter permease [Sporomusaceae bacterium]